MGSNLQEHLDRPLTRLTNISKVPASEIGERRGSIQNYLSDKDEKVKASPEGEAISFYLKNHAMAEIRKRVTKGQPLGEFEPLVDDYYETMQRMSLRMYYYLIVICNREARHAHSNSALSSLLLTFSNPLASYAKTLGHIGGANEAFKHLDSLPKSVSIGEFTKYLRDVFYKTSWGGGYGGEAWGQVSDVLHNFVIGKISAEIMLDTAFTLCHNNGPIFNKGYLFSMYNKGEIKRILDVQRAGQIPQFVATDSSMQIRKDHREFRDKAEKLLGSCMAGSVDWGQVNALGSLGTYESNVPESDPVQAVILKKIEAYKQIKLLEKKQKEHEEYMKNHIEIFPNEYVKKIERTE